MRRAEAVLHILIARVETVRFDVVNVFDTVYQIRSGTGIGVFSPQYGPRRGYFIGIKKKICADPSAPDCRNTASDSRRDYASGGFKWPTTHVPSRDNWSGFYIGLNAGGAFGPTTATVSGGGGSASVNEPGFIGGAQVGASRRTLGSFVRIGLGAGAQEEAQSVDVLL